jgi:hypothetical protein
MVSIDLRLIITAPGRTTMLLKLDRTLAVLLLLGAAGHTLGSSSAYAHQPMVLLWSLCATLALVLIAAVNLLRASRPGDRAVAWLAVGGTLSWLAVAAVFGVLIGHLLDPRVVFFEVASAGLIALGIRDAFQPRSAAQV